ncbi:hypothetical protein D3C78_1583610 [compost metagenome]
MTMKIRLKLIFPDQRQLWDLLVSFQAYISLMLPHSTTLYAPQYVWGLVSVLGSLQSLLQPLDYQSSVDWSQQR